MPVSREPVLRTSCDLFAERGYRGTSMKDIAEALGVRAPSLYNHVTSKQHILFAIMDTAMDRALGALEEALAGVDDVSVRAAPGHRVAGAGLPPLPGEVTICNTEVRSLDEENREAIVAKRDSYGSRVRDIIERGCRSGRFHTRSPQLAAFAVLELGNGAKSWFRPGGRYSDVEVAQEYGEFALRLVGAGRVRPRGTV